MAGPSATCPRPQIEVSRMVASSSTMRSSTSSGRPPATPTSSARIECAFIDPTRHGTHFPHDSLRKKRSTFVAAASRSVPSAMTTSAPEPSIEPASASGPA